MEGNRHPPAGKLLRVLGLTFAIAICVGSVIGGGILRTPGAVMDRVGDSGIVLLLWGLGGLHALLGANVVAEISTSVPKAGGLYVPTRRAFGDFAGMMVGWADWLVNGAATAALALVFADFAAMIAPGLAPYKPAVAIAVLASLFGLNWIGVREGSAFQKATSFAKVGLLLALIAIVFLFVPGAAPEPAAQPAPAWTVLTLVVAYQLIYGVFSGWPYPVFFIEEDQDPGKNIPRAMAVSIVAVTAIYLLVNAALLHALPRDVLRASELPAAAALAQVFGAHSNIVVAALALVIVASCINAGVMALPRILYGLGRDGLFLPIATRVNRGGTPEVGLFLSAALAIGLTLTGTFETVFLLMGALLIFLMIISEASLFALRIREPDLPRPFRAIFYPVLPALLMAIDAALLAAVLVADPMSGAYMFLMIGLSVPMYLWLRSQRRNAPAVSPLPLSEAE